MHIGGVAFLQFLWVIKPGSWNLTEHVEAHKISHPRINPGEEHAVLVACWDGATYKHHGKAKQNVENRKEGQKAVTQPATFMHKGVHHTNGKASKSAKLS